MQDWCLFHTICARQENIESLLDKSMDMDNIEMGPSPEHRSGDGSDSVYEEYGNVYEEYGAVDIAELNVDVGDISEENRNGNEIDAEEYEEYDGEYEPYKPGESSLTVRKHLCRPKITNKKLWWISLMAIIAGLVVGLSVHFTKPPPSYLLLPTTSSIFFNSTTLATIPTEPNESVLENPDCATRINIISVNQEWLAKSLSGCYLMIEIVNFRPAFKRDEKNEHIQEVYLWYQTNQNLWPSVWKFTTAEEFRDRSISESAFLVIFSDEFDVNKLGSSWFEPVDGEWKQTAIVTITSDITGDTIQADPQTTPSKIVTTTTKTAKSTTTTKSLTPNVTTLPQTTNSSNTAVTTMTTESTISRAVLLLSTYNSTNTPMLIELSGETNDDINFNYDTYTGVSGSCAASLNGKMFVLGGWNQRNQMSLVQDCSLTSVGELPFGFSGGGCNTFSFGILLCFSDTADQECHSFNGETFKKEASSKFPHYYVFALGSYRNSPFVTGQDSAINGLKTEILNYRSGEWEQVGDYPFSNGNMISHYAIASTSDSVFTIGGCTGGSPYITSIIAEYKNGNWKNVGNLAQARSSHGAITSGSVTMVVGGYPNNGGSTNTELWDFDSLESQIIDPTLSNYYSLGIGLFLVDANYCSKN